MGGRMLRTTIIVTFFLIFLVQTATADQIEKKIFIFYLDICRNDTVKLNSFEENIGTTSYEQTTGDYEFRLVSRDERILYKMFMDIFFVIHRDVVDEEGNMQYESIELDCREIFLRYPFFENSKRLEIYNKDKIISSIDIPSQEKPSACGNKNCETGETQENCCKDCGCQKAMECVNNKCVSKKCGNNKCDTDENYNTCPKDCPSGLGDGYCDGVKDGLCDPDCSKNEDVDCKSSKLFIYIIIGTVIIGLIFLILIKSRRGE